MWAAGYSDEAGTKDMEKVITILLDRGARLDDQDNRGRTPLMIAAELNHTVAIDLLLARGADKTLRDKEGKSAADLTSLTALREKLAAEDPDQIVLLAQLEGRPVAIGAAGAPSAAIFGDHGEIKNLYVDPNVKRQGIGRTLLSRLAAHLGERGFPGVGVGVVHGNEPAVAFYDALGGQRAGEYTDAGPIWRSRNIVFVWENGLVL